MDNLISGLIAAAVFIAFVAGLAESIGAVPFIVIVAIVIGMMLTDFVESARAGLREEKEKADRRR